MVRTVVGGAAVVAAALGVAEVVHTSSTPPPPAEVHEPKKVRLSFEGTAGVPMHVVGTRDGHELLFDTTAVGTYAQEYTVQVGEVVEFETSAAVDHVERRVTIKCVIQVDGKVVDTRPLTVRVGYPGNVRCQKTVHN